MLPDQRPQWELARMADKLDLVAPNTGQDLYPRRIKYYIMQGVERLHGNPHHLVMEVCDSPSKNLTKSCLFGNRLSTVKC